ncbi:hypothetical protein ABZ897_45140 [Nonomuraea sp. NPDC046802]|uniref:hypothetical protein n=1 Tax=Nonomuraea sp. NPDC046802 TaxID=3154919 RepID=UPI00340E8752
MAAAPGCIARPDPFIVRTAINDSSYRATLYTSDDCTGEPEAALDPDQRTSFRPPVYVGSVDFQETG